MPLVRKVVYVEESDLAAIKAAADSRAEEVEIIREAIHLAAVRVRRRKTNGALLSEQGAVRRGDL
ncbi:hypothetical protein ACFWUP_20450 [Nocardia sp. NPDC058658]|uniref:hypothetical protein n=1 Tax=Nocardia sp. NPDC058658 TaxID=3346580 RepID=UPI00364A68CE